MPRHARIVFAGIPHHVTQRGNHRERVFFSNGDPEAYLHLLREYATRHAIDVTAYCLMPNHIHLVVVPSTAHGLHRALRAVHSQYTQRVNRMRGLKGHLWQGRYFSSPLDANYFLNAIRYVERNPVEAGLAATPADYAWSSAAALCGFRSDPLVDTKPKSSLLAGIVNWSRWLAEGVANETLSTLRRHTKQNLRCGSSEFVEALERTVGQNLRSRSPGGQPGQKPRAEGRHEFPSKSKLDEGDTPH